MKFFLQKVGLAHFRIFSVNGRKLELSYYSGTQVSAVAAEKKG
jgi:hypothetical protein